MGVNQLLVLFTFIIVLFFISGCTPLPPQLTTSLATLKISEPIIYSFDIKNPSQLGVTKEFSNLNLEFSPSSKFIIDSSKTTIDKTSIKDGETARATISITSLEVGSFVIKGNLNYEDNGVKDSIPIQIDSITPQIGNERFLTIELKEKRLFINPSTEFGQPKTLHIIIKKEKDSQYSTGKIRIISAGYSQLDCIEGYECIKEKENELYILTDISKNREIPFQITINRPDPTTNSVSFKPSMELWYSKDSTSKWGKLTTSNFDVSSR